MNENDVRLLSDIDSRSKSNGHRIDKLEDEVKEIRTENKAIYELTTSIKLMAQDMTSIKTDLAEVKDGQKTMAKEVAEVKNKPAQETADIVMKVKVAVITAISTTVALGILGSVIYFTK